MKKLLLFGLLLVSGASMYAMEAEDPLISIDLAFYEEVTNFIEAAEVYETSNNFGRDGFIALEDLKAFLLEKNNGIKFLFGFENEKEREFIIKKVEVLRKKVGKDIEEIDKFYKENNFKSGFPVQNLAERYDISVKDDESKQSLLPDNKPPVDKSERQEKPFVVKSADNEESTDDEDDFYFPVQQPLFTQKRMLIGGVVIGTVVVIMGSSYGIYRYVQNTHAKGEETIFDRLFAKVGLKQKRTLEIA